jgi:hypothetical protein
MTGSTWHGNALKGGREACNLLLPVGIFPSSPFVVLAFEPARLTSAQQQKPNGTPAAGAPG